MDDLSDQIHPEHPFRTPPDERDPARRLRGRLALPVTVWTAAGSDGPAGLTVSSVLVAEGRPSAVMGLVNDTTDLWDAILASRRFVVHVLDEGQRVLAERFAGQRPSPGGLFEGLEVESGDFGPVLTRLEQRAHCSLVDTVDAGYQRMIRGLIDRVEVTDLSAPLIHFRGDFRGLRGT